MAAGADRCESPGNVATRARALNNPQNVSAISKELLVTNIHGGEGLLVKELLLGSHQQRIKRHLVKEPLNTLKGR